jgi:hypothetical protein
MSKYLDLSKEIMYVSQLEAALLHMIKKFRKKKFQYESGFSKNSSTCF